VLPTALRPVEVRGSRSPHWLFLVILIAMTATYLALAEVGKSYFCRHGDGSVSTAISPGRLISLRSRPWVPHFLRRPA
jgi:hypothetical protein